jgi:hypothetical protein
MREDVTTEEIRELKRQWENDPHWDIESTEGFEAHRDELLAFSNKKHDEWDQREKERIAHVAEKMGITGNTAVAYLIESLQRRVTDLEGKVGLIKSDVFCRE